MTAESRQKEVITKRPPLFHLIPLVGVTVHDYTLGLEGIKMSDMEFTLLVCDKLALYYLHHLLSSFVDTPAT
jgi:hypothetical protein